MSALAAFGCTEFGAWDLISGFDATLAEARLPKKRLPIDLSLLAQTSSLSEFPVLVRLEASFPYELCSPDGLDISFRAADGQTPLAYELEAWNPGGQSIFWVKIPTLAASPTSTTIWLYFSATYSLDGSNATAVWSNGYAAVWHGIVDTVAGLPSYRDSAGGNHATVQGATQQLAAGPGLGPAVTFPNPGSSFLIPDSAGLRNLGPFSLEFWILDSIPDQTGDIIIKGGFKIAVQSGQALQLEVPFDAGNLSISRPGIWYLDEWSSVALTWGGEANSEVAFYRGSILEGPLIASGNGNRISDEGTELVIAGKPSDPIKAAFDEIRISRVLRSEDWMRAQFLSQQGTNITLGIPEDVLYD